MANVQDYPNHSSMDTLRATGQTRPKHNIPPIFRPEQLKQSLRLIDLLACRLMPSRVFFDANANPAAAHIVVAASPKRVGLVFIGPNTGRVTISQEPNLSLDNGLTISSTSGIVALDSTTVGDCVTREWYAIGSAGGSILSWIEVYAPDNI